MPLVIKRSLFLFFIVLITLDKSSFSEAAQSAFPYRFYSDESNQIAYYKSKNSQFLSGKASRSQLMQNLISSSQEQTTPEDSFYQFGEQKISKKLLSPTFANSLSIKPGFADLGRFMVLKPSSLKKEAHSQSTSLLTIPAGELLYPLGHENGFIKVIFNKQKGFIDISSTLSKLDYAFAIYCEHPRLKVKQWYHVKNRVFDQVELIDGHQVPISKIEGVYTDSRIGIITNPKDSLPLWTKVILKKEVPQLEVWNQSYLKSEGVIWWKDKKNPASAKSESKTIDELLNKEVYSVSFHAKDPKKAIASTVDGVYISSNGVDWKLISQFQGFKGPVLYYNDHLIFVGSYKSTDGGKTFDRFINIAEISNVISKKIGFTPSFLKIKKIQSASSSKINIDVDAGFKTVKLQSAVYSQKWDVVKN